MGMNAEATVTLSLIDRISGPIARIGARLSAIGNRLGFDRIGGAAKKLGGAIAGLGDGLARTTGRLSSFLGILGFGSAGAIASAYGLAKAASDIGSEIGESSNKLGLGVEALQEYRFAASQSGIEAETLNKSIAKLGLNAVEASKGNKELGKAFRTLGVRVTDAKGKMRSTEDVLDDTMAALSQVKDPLKRNALAFKVFGKSGVELTKMLSGGADGLRELREEARRTGAIMGQSAVDAADELGDNIDALTMRFEGFKRFLGVQLIPVFNEAVKGITEWVDTNQDLIRSTITGWARSLVRVLKDLMNPASEVRKQIAGIVGRIEAFGRAIQPLIDLVGGPLNAALGAMAAWIFGPVLAALASLTSAFITLGIAIMTTPVGWIIAGLAAVGVAAYVLYQRWDEFVAYWEQAWVRIKDAFNTNFILGIWQAAKEFNPTLLIAKGMNAMIEYFTGIDLIGEGMRIIQSLWDGMKSAWNTGYAFVTDQLEQMKNAFATAPHYAYEAGAAIVQAVWDGLKSKWSEVVAWLQSAVNDLVGWLPDSIKEQLGFNITGSVASGPVATGATLGAMANMKPPSVALPQNTPGLPAAPAAGGAAGTVQTNTVAAQSIQIAEPILAHEPQTINAPLNVGGITVNVQGMTPDQAKAMVSGALANAQARQAASVKSSLSD